MIDARPQQLYLAAAAAAVGSELGVLSKEEERTIEGSSTSSSGSIVVVWVVWEHDEEDDETEEVEDEDEGWCIGEARWTSVGWAGRRRPWPSQPNPRRPPL